jgi:hypothetical protein
LSTFRIVNIVGESLNLKQIYAITGMFVAYLFFLYYFPLLIIIIGIAIGFSCLDIAFENSVNQRLYLADRIIPTGLRPQELDGMAWKIAKGREYQNEKCEYGLDNDTDFFTVAVPQLRQDYSNQDAWISNGEIKFRR